MGSYYIVMVVLDDNQGGMDVVVVDVDDVLYV